MVDFRRSRFRRPTGVGEAAPTQDPSPADSEPHRGLGWAVLGVAILLGLFLLVPFGLERSSAVMPATSTGPAPQTSGPQTWVLSSTVAAPGPVADDAARTPGHRRPGASTGSDLIIRVPVTSPSPRPRPATSAAPQRSPAPSSTAQLPTATAPTSPSPCPPSSATGVTPLVDDASDDDPGSTSGAGEDTGENTGDDAGTGTEDTATTSPRTGTSCAG